MTSQKKGAETTPHPTIPETESGSNPAKQRNEDTYFLAQKKRVFKAFFGLPKSMLQVSISTGILRSNITWFINDWLKTKSIQRVRTGICPITKRKVGLYSTNPMYWEKGGENAH